MSANPALPPRLEHLSDWAKQNLTELITAASNDDFNTAFDQFISKHVKKIVFNDRELTRTEYKQRLLKERHNFVGATINIRNVVEVPKVEKGGETTEASGNVGLFYNAQYREGPGPRNPSGPNSDVFIPHNIHSSLNIEVEQDSSVLGPVFEERRRVFNLNQVYLEDQFSIQAASS
ncbi:hypothetical protein A7U60_g4895 [Sanghuangporus baumii]|uniref:Uncharacterized protein n=1 Tax=Sanghuangporus baumii TaxID=108892 RepID=A0A9Q5HXP7_SANBA|nr:hypothetical protein A7U60_g4895 [Sanghuangporus baumii]